MLNSACGTNLPVMLSNELYAKENSVKQMAFKKSPYTSEQKLSMFLSSVIVGRDDLVHQWMGCIYSVEITEIMIYWLIDARMEEQKDK